MSLTNENFNLKYHWIANTCILEIFANILMSYVNFKYIETYSVNANIVVSSFFIFFNLSLFLYLRKKHIFRSSLFIDDGTSRLNTILIIIGLFLIFCIKHFLLLAYTSMVDVLSNSFEKMPDLKVAVLAGFIFAIFMMQCILFLRQFLGNHIERGVSLMIRKFSLDRGKTYFFGDIALSSFKVNKYVYSVAMGLAINDRYYSPEVILDYFNMVGISFNDLDEGHAKNIEMYNV